MKIYGNIQIELTPDGGDRTTIVNRPIAEADLMTEVRALGRTMVEALEDAQPDADADDGAEHHIVAKLHRDSRAIGWVAIEGNAAQHTVSSSTGGGSTYEDTGSNNDVDLAKELLYVLCRAAWREAHRQGKAQNDTQ